MALPAQISPPANTLSDAYVVPSGKATVISSLIVCNTNSITALIRVSVAIGGAVDNISQYIYYDLGMTKKNTLSLVAGIGVLNPGDTIRVWSDKDNVAFNINGEEA